MSGKLLGKSEENPKIAAVESVTGSYSRQNARISSFTSTTQTWLSTPKATVDKSSASSRSPTVKSEFGPKRISSDPSWPSKSVGPATMSCGRARSIPPCRNWIGIAYTSTSSPTPEAYEGNVSTRREGSPKHAAFKRSLFNMAQTEGAQRSSLPRKRAPSSISVAKQ